MKIINYKMYIWDKVIKNGPSKVCGRQPYPYPFEFFKGCLPQILLGPFLNTLTHIQWQTVQSCMSTSITFHVNLNILKYLSVPPMVQQLDKCRSSRPEVFCKKVVLRNFAKLTGKHMCQSLFFDKAAGRRPEACFCK